MDVLTLLASQPGQVIPREVILDTVWAKKFLADSALASAISELRKALGDDPVRPTYIQTIPKRGYRLVPPVVPAAAQAEPTGAPAAATPADAGRPAAESWRRPAALLGVAGIVVAASVGAVVGLRGTPREAARLEVLPFENLGPAEVAYLAAGVTEEVATTLAAIPGVQVVRRSGSAPAATAGATPGADPSRAGYVLGGSVRWGGRTEGVVRITPRLVSNRDGTTMWSRVYESSTDDVFALQTSIARTVALHVDFVLRIERSHTFEKASTDDPEAHQAYLRGLYELSEMDSPRSQLEAILLLEQAVARDPAYVAPYVALARTNAMVHHLGIDRSAQRLASAREARDRLQALAPGRPETLVAAAFVAFAEMDYRGAAATLDAAGEAGHFPFGRGFRADIARRLGRFEEALGLYREWLDCSPIRAADLYEQIGTTAAFLGKWEEADRAYQTATTLDPGRHTAYMARARNALLWTRSLAAARAELDRDVGRGSSSQICERWLLALLERDWATALALVQALPPEGGSTQCQRVPASLLLGETRRLAGDADAAREAFEATRVTLEREVADNADDFRRWSSLGVAYAGLGRREEAVSAGERAVALCPVARDAVRGSFYLERLALTHVMTGALDDAVATLDVLFSGPRHPAATPLLDLDPRWEPLRGHPAYARLAALVGRAPALAVAASASAPSSES